MIVGTSDGLLSFWSWPTMKTSIKSQNFDDEEIVDVHVDATSANVVVVTETKLRILDLLKGKVRFTMQDIKVGNVLCTIRGARFGSNTSNGILFVILNAKNRKKAFIQKYSSSTWTLLQTKEISQKPITAFSISAGGGLLAFGSSAMSVTVLETLSLTVS